MSKKDGLRIRKRQDVVEEQEKLSLGITHMASEITRQEEKKIHEGRSDPKPRNLGYS